MTTGNEITALPNVNLNRMLSRTVTDNDVSECARLEFNPLSLCLLARPYLRPVDASFLLPPHLSHLPVLHELISSNVSPPPPTYPLTPFL